MSELVSVSALLAGTPLFGTLSQSDRLAVAQQMREAVFEPGQVIFARGDPGRDLHLVLEGRVRLSILSLDGRVLSFNHACAGQIFGEIAALDGGLRSADATALTRVRTRTLTRGGLMHLIHKQPSLARAAIAFLCARLRDTSEQVETIALHPIEVRLARFLLSALKLHEGRAETARIPLDLGMSQGELALLIGASRQKVNAALAVLEEAGAVKRLDGLIECNALALERLAQRELA
jgi:CRP-like cAMP-binding protein